MGTTMARQATLALVWAETRDRAPFWLLLGAVATVLVSIAASQILLAGAIGATAWHSVTGRTRFDPWKPILLPLALYLAWGIMASFFAHDVAIGLRANRKIFLYAILFLTPMVVKKGEEHLAILRAVFAMSSVAALYGLIQYAMQPQRDLLNRISGFMSIWMTYAGLLMLALIALVGYALSRRRIEWWTCLLGLMILAALILSETRNAWVGAAAGIATALIMRRPRALLFLIPLLAVLFLVAPDGIKERVRSTWNPKDDNTRNRIELLGTSLRLIGDNPWVGVGPENVAAEALRYRGTHEFPNFMYQHMHNNFLQIASERGIPGLLLWLWFMGRLGWDSVAVFRQSRATPPGDPERDVAMMVSTIALGALAALLVAGLAEWNFNDSEVLIFFMFLVAAPYTYRRAAPAQIPVAARTSP
jgi:O-antigen ligase